jgi:hypothetical protein
MVDSELEQANGLKSLRPQNMSLRRSHLHSSGSLKPPMSLWFRSFSQCCSWQNRSSVILSCLNGELYPAFRRKCSALAVNGQYVPEGRTYNFSQRQSKVLLGPARVITMVAPNQKVRIKKLQFFIKWHFILLYNFKFVLGRDFFVRLTYYVLLFHAHYRMGQGHHSPSKCKLNFR